MVFTSYNIIKNIKEVYIKKSVVSIIVIEKRMLLIFDFPSLSKLLI